MKNQKRNTSNEKSNPGLKREIRRSGDYNSNISFLIIFNITFWYYFFFTFSVISVITRSTNLFSSFIPVDSILEYS